MHQITPEIHILAQKNIWKKNSIVKYIFMPKNHKNINFELKISFFDQF